MPTPQQRKKLRDALMSAFPSKSLLERLLYFELEKNLNEITKDSDLQEIVFKLIQTAESQGWLIELVRAARQENPGNSDLVAIALELLPSATSSAPKPSTSNSVTVILPKQGQEVEGSSGIISEFDVFLAHNSADKLQVRAIAFELKQLGLKPWLDDEEILPGEIFQVEIQKAIRKVKSAIIFIGEQGLGRWQEKELPTLYSQFVNAENITTVIPVLLPGVNAIPEDLLFLKQHHWVSFSEGIDDVKALRSLVSGITRQKPQPTLKVIPQPSDDLSSEKGVDYTRLRDLLAARNWKDADYQTYLVMLKVVGRENGDWIRDKELLNFPCTDLRTIDNLWVKYSNGRFGFSVQKNIYLEVGGKADGEYHEEAWLKFVDRVGWRGEKGKEVWTSVTFDTSAPPGHLPVSRGDWSGPLASRTHVARTLLSHPDL